MILEQLKSETAAAHASLEQRLRIARQTASLQDYRNYLHAMYGFTAPLEQRLRELTPRLSSDLELELRCKSSLLASDLASLDQRLEKTSPPLAWCEALPEHRSATQALGILYVLEGSTLGARWLLRHLQPLGIDDCSRYLRSYGEALGAMWEKLRRVLVRHAEQHPERAGELLAAAHDTFRKLDDWCVRCQAAEASAAT